MTNGSSTIEQFWYRTRNNLSVASYAHHTHFWIFESSIWFHMLANSMLSIYIPILMLQSGFTLSEILLFYIFFHCINVPFNLVAGYAITKWGARTTIIIATLFQIGFFITYAGIEPGEWTILLLMGALAGIYDALYYTAATYLFMRTTIDANNSGKNTGILYAVVQSASLLGPMIGSGLLLLEGNKLWVIIMIIIAFIFSIIPLFLVSLEQGHRTIMMPIRKFIKEKYVLANHAFLGLFKIHESITAIMWPIFIFLYFNNLESVALLAIMVPLASLVFSFLSGRINLRYRYHVIALGSALIAAIWIGRIMIEHGGWYYISVIMVGILVILMQVPIDANIYRSGNESNPLTAAVVRNMVSMGTKGILFVVLWVLSVSFTSAFAIAVIALMTLTALSLGRIIIRNRANKIAI